MQVDEANDQELPGKRMKMTITSTKPSTETPPPSSPSEETDVLEIRPPEGSHLDSSSSSSSSSDSEEEQEPPIRKKDQQTQTDLVLGDLEVQVLLK